MPLYSMYKATDSFALPVVDEVGSNQTKALQLARPSDVRCGCLTERCLMLFAALGGEDLLYLCGMCPIFPLVVLLVIVALIRNSLWPAGLALLIAGVPYVVLQITVALYESSADGEVTADQFTGR